MVATQRGTQLTCTQWQEQLPVSCTRPLSPFASASSPASWKLLGPHLRRPEVRQIHFHQRCRAAKVYTSGADVGVPHLGVVFFWFHLVGFYMILTLCSLPVWGIFQKIFSPFLSSILQGLDSHPVSLCSTCNIFPGLSSSSLILRTPLLSCY